MTTQNICALITKFPLVKWLIDLEEVVWFNPNITTLEEGLPFVGLGAANIKDASERLKTLCSILSESFPRNGGF